MRINSMFTPVDPVNLETDNEYTKLLSHVAWPLPDEMDSGTAAREALARLARARISAPLAAELMAAYRRLRRHNSPVVASQCCLLGGPWLDPDVYPSSLFTSVDAHVELKKLCNRKNY